MATILAAYGWGCGNAMIPDVDNGGCGLESASHTGLYSLGVGNAGTWSAWCRFPIAGTPSDPSISVWLYNNKGYNTTANSDTMGLGINFLTSDGKRIGLRWNGSTHTFDAYVDGTLVASGSVEVSYNGWFHLQLYIVISDTGSIQAKINGHESINYSGNTMPGTSSTASYLYIYGPQASYGTHNGVFVDDLVIGSGGLLGDLRCYDIRPTADTAQADWTPSTGTDHYAMLDETGPNDAEYVSADLDGAADELELEGFTEADKAPVAVVAWVRAKADDASGANIKVGVDSGGVDDTEAHALSASWEYYAHIMDINPADGLDWELPDVNAIKIRYEADLP